ncbi:MAG: hypothetical protein EPO58_11590 [Chitinophagaceae bacterium]|nr:MAG: hypothetical protein EPO58_11590 [Chitinophagaceae bacterium]
MKKYQRLEKRSPQPKKTKKKLSDFDMSVLLALFGVVILATVILNKTFDFSIPIFGEELDLFGINWKIYVKRNRLWFIVSSLMIVIGVLKAITIVISINNKTKQNKSPNKQ